MAEEKKNSTNSDEIIFYEIMIDSYVQRYPFRTWIFSKVLRHMLSKIHTESTIFFLMQEVKKNK